MQRGGLRFLYTKALQAAACLISRKQGVFPQEAEEKTVLSD